MEKLLYLIGCFIVAQVSLSAQVLPNYGGERAGLSALSFLKNDLSPRSSALGGTGLALSGDAYSVMNNPAALTDLKSTSYAVSHLFLGGGVNQSFLSANFPLKDKSSTLAFSINSLNSGEMEERTEFMPMGTGRQISVSNIALGATYARQLSSLFTAAVTIKYIYEGVAGFHNSNATVDLAFLYKTDFRDLKFAVMVQNFGGNSALGSDADLPTTFNRNTGIGLEANSVPTIFKLGLSIMAIERGNHSVLGAVQLNHPNDNAENYSAGLEYKYLKHLFIRAGYRISVRDRDFPTFGFGVRTRLGNHPLYIDYAANPTNFIGLQHSIGLRVQILKTIDR
ncbi:MAG: hypothetical protein ACJAZH_000952 [Roseivirga sp.]|jgi:hypothetical protein